MQHGFTLEKAAAVGGVPRATVKDWLDRGLIELDASRRQQPARCTLEDLVRVAITAWLTKAGVGLKHAVLVAGECVPLFGEWFVWLKSNGRAPLGTAFVVGAHHPGREGLGLRRVADLETLTGLLARETSRPLLVVPVFGLFEAVLAQISDADLVPLADAGERVLEIA